MPNLSRNDATGKALNLPKYIETELGTEKLCIQCNEYWPLDEEFWWKRKNKSKVDPDRVVYEAACICCYDIRYRPHRVKGTNKIKSTHERIAA